MKLNDEIHRIIELCVERVRDGIEKGEVWKDNKDKNIGQAKKRILGELEKQKKLKIMDFFEGSASKGFSLVVLISVLFLVLFWLGVSIGKLFPEWRVEISAVVIVLFLAIGLSYFIFGSGKENDENLEGGKNG